MLPQQSHLILCAPCFHPGEIAVEAAVFARSDALTHCACRFLDELERALLHLNALLQAEHAYELLLHLGAHLSLGLCDDRLRRGKRLFRRAAA